MNVFALVVILLILAAFAVDKYVHKQLEKRQLRRCSLIYTLASYAVYLALMLAVVYTQIRADISQVVINPSRSVHSAGVLLWRSV